MSLARVRLVSLALAAVVLLVDALPFYFMLTQSYYLACPLVLYRIVSATMSSRTSTTAMSVALLSGPRAAVSSASPSTLIASTSTQTPPTAAPLPRPNLSTTHTTKTRPADLSNHYTGNLCYSGKRHNSEVANCAIRVERVEISSGGPPGKEQHASSSQ